MPVTLHATLQPDDDILLDDGLPCLRRDGKLYYLGDVQPRVLEACRHFEIGFEQLSEKLGLARPALVLILKGYDPVPPPLRAMIDRLVGQAGLLPPAPADCRLVADADAPMPDKVITVTAEDLAAPQSGRPRIVLSDSLAPDSPAPDSSVPDSLGFDAGLPGITPGLHRALRRRSLPEPR